MECTSCGAAIHRRDAFCAKCGTVTQRGKGPLEPIANFIREALNGFVNLASSGMEYVINPSNRRRVLSVGAICLPLFVALGDNPISRGVGSFFDSHESPVLTEDGQPDLAAYEDVYIGDEEEFFVMGKANVRDFPTSQGTRVTDTFSGGETVLAREVKAFDPTSQWFKLTSGGYVWGGNLESLAQIAHEAGYTFPRALVGRWSNHASCVGSGPDREIELTIDTVRIGVTRYGMVNILAAGEEIPVYELAELRNGIAEEAGITVQEDARYPAIWITYKSDLTGKAYRYYRSDYLCSDVRAIAGLGTGM